MMQQFLLGQPTKIHFTAAEGLIVFPDFVLVGPAGGVVVVTPTYSEVAPGFYQATFLVDITGYYNLRVGGQTHVFEVVRKTSQGYLTDISDGTIGSWQWNKVSGELILLRSTGEVLATYQVTDGSDSASREKLT